jgi:hypothetical protein
VIWDPFNNIIRNRVKPEPQEYGSSYEMFEIVEVRRIVKELEESSGQVATWFSRLKEGFCDRYKMKLAI